MINICWLENLWTSVNFGLLNPQSSWINHVTQVFHMNMKEPAIVWMKFMVMFFKSSKHLLQMMHVIS
jgi:hypothetical protein